MKILNRPVRVWQAALVAAALALLAVTGSSMALDGPSARSAIREKPFKIAPGQTERARALCQHQRDGLALGGGIQVNDPKLELVRDSYPWRDRDGGPRQDDGWEGTVQNTGTETLGAVVYVTCG
jgi:hypothetical protein